jgi:hypothetical protein
VDTTPYTLPIVPIAGDAEAYAVCAKLKKGDA